MQMVRRLAVARWLTLTAAVVLGTAQWPGKKPVDVHADADDNVESIDHRVAHVSTLHANAGQTIHLNVRERRRVNRDSEEVALMLHGASTPVLPGFELRTDRGHYDWALSLAKSGVDVFMLDLQGSGLSARPRMDDPCNAPASDQARALIPYQIPATCPPSYPYQLNNSGSDWAELDTVVDYIRALRGVEKVHLLAWSQGSFRIGPYSVMHPEKVESLFMVAPIYNPAFRSGTGPGGFNSPVPLPQPGTPMTLRTKGDFLASFEDEDRCDGQVEDGIPDLVWDRVMENDDLGSTWGPPPAGAPEGSAPEGVMRIRTIFQWGWNANMAARVTVPILIIRGEYDNGGGGLQRLEELYRTVASTTKLRFLVQCAGHRIPWESQRRHLHHISKEWIKHQSVGGFGSGEFFVDTEGNLSPL